MRPSISLWLCSIYLAKTYLIFIASLTYRENSEGLLALFYPVKQDLYIGMLIGITGLFIFILCGFREKVWKTGKAYLFSAIKFSLLLGLLSDMIFNLYLAQQQYWLFSWNIGAIVLLDFYWLYWALSSKYLAFMLLDWKFELSN